MTLRFFTLLWALSWAVTGSVFAAGDDTFSIEPDIVCRRQNSPRNTLCPKLEHLRLRIGLGWTESIALRLAYDAQHQTKVTWANSYDLHVQRLPPRSSWLDDYAVRLRLAPGLELGLEDWAATTLIPDASGLGFSRLLQDSGWNQTVLRLSWINPDLRVLAASLIVGQGEGERLEANDQTPYLGALTRIEVAQSLSLQLGWSYDGNYLQPDSLFWLSKQQRQEAAPHFSASRYAASLFLDGSHPQMRGLRLSLGWQKNRIKGPERIPMSLAADPVDGPFEPTELLAEALGGRSDLDRQTWMLGGSYEILDSFILAFHVQNLTIDLGDQHLLKSCASLDSQGKCLDAANAQSSLQVRANTFGVGKKSDRGWSLMFESMHESYDRLYELYHFAPGSEQRQRRLQILQLRLSAKL